MISIDAYSFFFGARFGGISIMTDLSTSIGARL